MSNSVVAQCVREQEAYTLQLRRDLHRIPELRFEEHKTMARLLSEVRAIISKNTTKGQLSITEKTGGFWVDLLFPSAQHLVVFRADCDGLPVLEQTGLAFASERKGFMHACGHDFHMAWLLGAFRALVSGGSPVAPNMSIRFVFQRAEENPNTQSGGDRLVNDEKVLEGVSLAYAVHVEALGECGVLTSREGNTMANSDRMRINISASGGHASAPHRASNALEVASAVMEGLKSFPATTLGPLEPCALVPTILQSGSASNVIPDKAELMYGVRTFLLPKDRQEFHRGLVTKVRALVSSFPGASVQVDSIMGHPVLRNDAEALSLASRALKQEGVNVQFKELPSLGGEDFAHYTLKVPGCYFFLGAQQESGPLSGDHHAPSFNPSERVLNQGVLFWLALAAHLEFRPPAKL